MITDEQVQPLVAWANERHAIYLRKQWLNEMPSRRMDSQTAAAWKSMDPTRWTLDQLTDDPIMKQFRFCNVYRELDRVTVWIRENIREPFSQHSHLWFMLAVARTINWPPTLAELIRGGPVDDAQVEYRVGLSSWPSHQAFLCEKMALVMEDRRRRHEKVETGAYMIRAESNPAAPWYKWSKQAYVAEIVLGRLWADRFVWQQFMGACERQGGTLRSVWERLQPYIGWGPFMAYQVAVDLRWTRYLRNASDIQSWAALGPGSRRGLNRLHGRPVKAPLSQDQGLWEMLWVREVVNKNLAPWMDPIDLSDIQNCLCEYDKYERVRLGEGRPRAQYVPGRGW